MIALYPDQQLLTDRIRDALRRVLRVLVVAPCGFGKTVVFCYMALRALMRGKRVLILTHRSELVDQVSETLRAFDVPHAIIAPGFMADRGQYVQVASVQTLIRRLDHYHKPDLIIADEAHHVLWETTFGKVIAHYADVRCIGVTASPERLSGEGLGAVFNEMILGPDTAELIERGRLSRYRLFAPDHPDTSQIKTRRGDFETAALSEVMNRPTITGNALAHYRKHTHQLPALAYCVSVQAAHAFAETMRNAGYTAAALDGMTDRRERKQTVADFKAGRIHVLSSCSILSEGFDCPGAHVGIFLRPTQSLALFIQQMGRPMRVAKDKPYTFLMDHANLTSTHGLPDDPREWSLEGRDRARRREEEQPTPIRTCPKCYAVVRASVMVCECGHRFVAEGRTVEVVDGELAEVDVEALRRSARREEGAAQTLDDLIKLGRVRGYRYPEAWARHKMRARTIRRRA